MSAQFLYLEVECGARDALGVRRAADEAARALWGAAGAPCDVLAARDGGAVLRVMLRAGDAQHAVLVAPRELLAEPSSVTLPEPEPAPGLILADGSINWGCPCLGGMATGPCGNQFRDAFSCFHYSEAEPKGSDCYEKFSVMQSCMAEYPDLYGKDDDDLAAALDEAGAAAGPGAGPDQPAGPDQLAGDQPAAAAR